jgi:hypothetical protein
MARVALEASLEASSVQNWKGSGAINSLGLRILLAKLFVELLERVRFFTKNRLTNGAHLSEAGSAIGGEIESILGKLFKYIFPTIVPNYHNH